MLDEMMFEDEMGKLQAAHGRRVTSEASKYWYALARDMTEENFKRVIDRLTFGERFPTFGMFRQCRKDTEVMPEQSERYVHKSRCQWCEGDGKLTVERSDSQGVIGRCMACKLVTPSNSMLMEIWPESLQNGYELHHSHILKKERHDRLVANGEDPFVDETPTRQQLPAVGTAVGASSQSGAEKESQRNFSKEKETERELNTWHDQF
jgi:hypothetical protein